MVANRLAVLSGVVATAGATDLAEGTELLAAADDVRTMSAVVGLMSLGDLERGLEVGRVAGELGTISEVVKGLRMPILALMLSDRGAQLQRIATDTILRAAATRSLAKIMAATGQQIGELEEGVLRVVAAEIAAERSAELQEASERLAQRGALEGAVASAAPEDYDASFDDASAYEPTPGISPVPPDEGDYDYGATAEGDYFYEPTPGTEPVPPDEDGKGVE